ncbi:hypothetical protein C1H46_024872 [Malus baccata]|uniref:Uncharacterized protein n=1 Tax=Malus baccata TaxID=106549 RepID=A0A540LSV5_MALBA|nr:hypothetical protein C1H46_024872 [Malus baccata]
MEIVTLKQSSPPSNSVKANDEIPSALAAGTKLLTKYSKTSPNKRGTERAGCCRKGSGDVEFAVQGLSRNRRLTLKPFCFACQNFDMVLVGGESLNSDWILGETCGSLCWGLKRLFNSLVVGVGIKGSDAGLNDVMGPGRV